MLSIDGSEGEAGGQILRTALASSLLTSVPFRIEKIRAGRHRPGLLSQHLTAVEAAAEIGSARTEGAELGSELLVFEPGDVRSGRFHFDIGTAGSTGLVLQTVLLPLLTTDDESELVITGGTHNQGGPPFEFLDLSFTPLLRRMGADLSLSLERYGFYPAGGGRIRARIGNATWTRIDLPERGPVRSLRARSLVSRLPVSIAQRELAVVEKGLAVPKDGLTPLVVEADSPGNALLIMVTCEEVTTVFTGFGKRGLPAEDVASRTVAEARHYLDYSIAVDTHLADQLLLPVTQSGGGSFVTSQLSGHFWTNVKVIEEFFGLSVSTSRKDQTVTVDCHLE